MAITLTWIADVFERRADAVTCVVLAGWAAFMLFVKFRLAHYGLATDDLYNYANALYNTNFWDKWLFVARYEVGRGLPSLVFDHWQPTTLILWPLVHLFGPHSLLVVQAVAPIWAAYWLTRIGRHQGQSGFDRLFIAGICLFSPYMMLAVMDSIEGYHATSLLLVFGAPLAWAAVTNRWKLSLILLLIFLNVRENAALYVVGAGLGYLLFRNGYFDGTRRALLAVAIAAAVFWIGIKGAPILAGVPNFHFSKLGHAVGSSSFLKLDFLALDKDWAAFLLGLWPALASPGALLALVPESLVLIVADKKIVNWYGMSLVVTGALAASFGLTWIRRRLRSPVMGALLTLVLIAHLGLLAATSPLNVWRKADFLIDRYGFHVPQASLAAARAAIDVDCRTSVFFQAMKGFGDLPYLQYPHPQQAERSRTLVVSKRGASDLEHNLLQAGFAETLGAKARRVYDDAFLSVIVRPDVPCVAPANKPGN